MHACSPESLSHPELHKKCGQQVEGDDAFPLLRSLYTSPGVLCSVLWFMFCSNLRQTWTCWSRFKGRPWRLSEGWSCLRWRRFWEDVIAVFQYVKGACKKKLTPSFFFIFSKICTNTVPWINVFFFSLKTLSLSQAGSATAGCSRQYPVGFWLLS